MNSRSTLLLFVFGAVAATASAGTVRVDGAGGGDYVTIMEGIEAAAQGDTVLVAAGTYSGPGNRDISFGGKDVYLLSESGPELTIIDCEHEARGFVILGGQTQGTVIEGFTVTNGAPPDTGDTAGWGGAVYCANSAPVILSCAFTNNSGSYGGAIYAGISAIMEIVYCDFSGNEADYYGGAVYTYGAKVSIAKCVFTDNESGISGGAVCCKTGTLVYLADCDFFDNTAPDGGAVYIGTFDEGGTEPEEQSKVYWCNFTGNTAERGGGLFINGFTWVSASACVFDYNTALQHGGAIYALTDYTRSLSVNQCTMVFNGAEHGGGIYSAGDYGFELAITQSVFAFGTGGAAVQAEDYNTVSPAYCVSFGNVGGDNLEGRFNIVEDPLFCDLYGGDYHVCENSICLPDNHPQGFSVGRYTASYSTCDACASPVRNASWSSIKAMFR